MKLNQDICHRLLSGSNQCAKIGDQIIWGSNEQKLLDLKIDRNLSVNEYVFSLCKKKLVKKFSDLARLSIFMSIKQRKVLMKSFIVSQFGYCSLIWMFHARGGVDNKINHLHERSHQIVYKVVLALLSTSLRMITCFLFVIEIFSHLP